jgi:hypothetical protein
MPVRFCRTRICARLSLGVCVALGVAFAVAGCGHMPVTSMIKLARVDFATSDPAQLRVAVKLPRAVQPLPRGVAMRIGVKLSDNPEAAQDFVLRELTEDAELAPLAREADADSRIFAYRLDEADVARLTAFRAGLMQRKQAGQHGSIAISIRPQGCRTEELPAGPISFTSYLRTVETGSYVTLARDVDLRTIAPGREIAAEIPACR